MDDGRKLKASDVGLETVTLSFLANMPESVLRIFSGITKSLIALLGMLTQLSDLNKGPSQREVQLN